MKSDVALAKLFLNTYLQLVLAGLSLWGGVGEIDGENLVNKRSVSIPFYAISN
jgi:hypothetical protein